MTPTGCAEKRKKPKSCVRQSKAVLVCGSNELGCKHRLKGALEDLIGGEDHPRRRPAAALRARHPHRHAPAVAAFSVGPLAPFSAPRIRELRGPIESLKRSCVLTRDSLFLFLIRNEETAQRVRIGPIRVKKSPFCSVILRFGAICYVALRTLRGPLILFSCVGSAPRKCPPAQFREAGRRPRASATAAASRAAASATPAPTVSCGPQHPSARRTVRTEGSFSLGRAAPLPSAWGPSLVPGNTNGRQVHGEDRAASAPTRTPHAWRCQPGWLASGKPS